MAFQIKDFVSIVASMINHAKATQDKITDFNIGSVVRTLIEAPAVEIDELYQQMFNGLMESIPVAIYNSFEFDRLSATPANGTIRVTITSQGSAVVIPSGTEFASTSLTVKFTSQTDATITAGNTYVDVFVSCSTSGVASNIAASVSFTMTPAPAGFVSASNAAAFTNGSDEETDDQRKGRFAEFIASLNHGTGAALLYGLKTSQLTDVNGLVTEYVKHASVYEPYIDDNQQPIAWVQCFIHNGTTGASSNLIARAAEVIDGYYDSNGNPVSGWKAAGVKVDVAAAANVTVAVTATLTAEAGYSSAALITQVTAAIQAYLYGLDIGKPALRAEIIAAAMAIEGVYNFVMTVPAVDTTTTHAQKIVPGTFTIT